MASPGLLFFRVFLSSPGDVGNEREAAHRLLTDLPRRPWLRGRAAIQTVAWDDPAGGTPMDATHTAQASVERYNPRPSEVDLTIVILWGRLGTRLPPGECKPNGDPYRSGTEFELEDARRAGKPLWIYRRRRGAPDMEDAAYAEKNAQYQALRGFFAGLRNDDGSIVGGVNEYDDPSGFTRLLESHLEAELRRVLDERDRTFAVEDRFRIFLADAADELKSWRGRLKTQLAAMPNVRLLDDVPPPYEREEHATATREAVRDADLTVHLLGPGPGAAVADQAGSTVDAASVGETYPGVQLRAALDAGRSRLIIHPTGFRLETVTDTAYRKLLTEARQREDSRVRLEIVSTTPLETQDIVLDKRRAILDDRRRAAENARVTPRVRRAVLIDVHDLDRGRTRNLFEYLRGRITTLPDDANMPDATTDKVFENMVSLAQYVIVVFGEVAAQWTLARLEEAVKIALEREQRLKCGVYLCPGTAPPNGRDGGFLPPRYSTVIDNTAGFDVSPIKNFLGL